MDLEVLRWVSIYLGPIDLLCGSYHQKPANRDREGGKKPPLPLTSSKGGEGCNCFSIPPPFFVCTPNTNVPCHTPTFSPLSATQILWLEKLSPPLFTKSDVRDWGGLQVRPLPRFTPIARLPSQSKQSHPPMSRGGIEYILCMLPTKILPDYNDTSTNKKRA